MTNGNGQTEQKSRLEDGYTFGIHHYRLRGQPTTTTIEHAFWRYLERAAEVRGLSAIDLVRQLHENVHSHRTPGSNFTQTLRVWCMEDCWSQFV